MQWVCTTAQEHAPHWMLERCHTAAVVLGSAQQHIPTAQDVLPIRTQYVPPQHFNRHVQIDDGKSPVPAQPWDHGRVARWLLQSQRPFLWNLVCLCHGAARCD